MTDLIAREDNRPTSPAAPTQQPAAPVYETSALVQWAFEAKQAHQIAQSLAQTSFVPASLRGKPQDITAAILAGQELGLQPMATLRSLDVIQGTPALRAHAMRGLVQSHGHKIQVMESTDKVCRMRGRRKDEGDDDWQTVEWTIEQAQQLGLMSKDQWKKQPKNMLVARATGVICRLVAADVLFAMPYASEELGDDGFEQAPVRVSSRASAQEILANAASVRSAAPVSPAPTGAAPAIERDAQQAPDPDAVWAQIQAAAGELGWDPDSLEQRVLWFVKKPSDEADGFELQRFLDAVLAGEVQ